MPPYWHVTPCFIPPGNKQAPASSHNSQGFDDFGMGLNETATIPDARMHVVNSIHVGNTKEFDRSRFVGLVTCAAGIGHRFEGGLGRFEVFLSSRVEDGCGPFSQRLGGAGPDAVGTTAIIHQHMP